LFLAKNGAASALSGRRVCCKLITEQPSSAFIAQGVAMHYAHSISFSESRFLFSLVFREAEGAAKN
jgi:hypothetical protein